MLDILEIDLHALNNPPRILKPEPPEAPVVITPQVMASEIKAPIISPPQQPKITVEHLATHTTYPDFIADMVDQDEIIGPLIQCVVDWKRTNGEYSCP